MKCYMVLEIINGPTYKIPETLLQTGQRPKEYRHYNSDSKVELPFDYQIHYRRIQANKIIFNI